MQKLAIYIIDSGNHEMIKTHISLSSTMKSAETEKQITCEVVHLHHMYHYFTNLASFRTLASLKILKIAKTSSIPPSSCFTTSSHCWLPKNCSFFRFKENLSKSTLASGAVVVMMLEGVVDSPSSSMETLKSKHLKFRRLKCNDELFHLNPNPQKCSF